MVSFRRFRFTFRGFGGLRLGFRRVQFGASGLEWSKDAGLMLPHGVLRLS